MKRPGDHQMLGLSVEDKFLYLQDSQVEEDYVKCYLRQNEDYSLGHSSSDSSEKLLQRGRRESQYM